MGDSSLEVTQLKVELGLQSKHTGCHDSLLSTRPPLIRSSAIPSVHRASPPPDCCAEHCDCGARHGPALTCITVWLARLTGVQVMTTHREGAQALGEHRGGTCLRLSPEGWDPKRGRASHKEQQVPRLGAPWCVSHRGSCKDSLLAEVRIPEAKDEAGVGGGPGQVGDRW